MGMANDLPCGSSAVKANVVCIRLYEVPQLAAQLVHG